MYLGIDLGTSEVKLLLLDADHQVVAVTGEALQISRPHPLWSEQHPHVWWAALDGAMRRLEAQHGGAMARVRAIGLAGQMHGAVLLDAASAVTRAPRWSQQYLNCVPLRATSQCPASPRRS